MGDYNFLNLDKRVFKDLEVSEQVCIDGLVDTTQCLFAELRDYLEDENRSFGIVTSYIKTLREAFKKFNKDFQTEESMELLGRVTYLYKPLILSNFKRLSQKNLSKADCVITIMKRLLDVIIELSPNNYKYTKEVKTISEVITKLFNNIRNNGKNIKLNYLIDSIKKYTKLGQVGKFSIDGINFRKEEDKKKINDNNTLIEWSVDL